MGRIEDDEVALVAAVREEIDAGFAFSLFISCDDGVVPEEPGASTGSAEGSGATRLGDGVRAESLGGGIWGMGKSVCTACSGDGG